MLLCIMCKQLNYKFIYAKELNERGNLVHNGNVVHALSNFC